MSKNPLWLYEAVSRSLPLKYNYKVLLVAFVGIHVPLLALVGYFVALTAAGREDALQVLAVALAATLAGTAATLYVLTHLLRPVLLTSAGLRDYVQLRKLPQLPTGHADEVGTLMADASHSLSKLDRTLDLLGHYDQVTALPNRLLLLRRLAERGEGAGPYALCVLAVRNHEKLLAAFGQEAGNGLLRALTSHLEVRGSLHVQLSRVGANLFAFVLEGTNDASEAAARAGSILAGVPHEYQIGQVKVVPEVALGVSLCPQDADDPEALLNNAISASASAPSRGAGPVAAAAHLFSARSRDEVRDRFLLEQDLRRAVDQGEFVLHYQPVVDLAERCVVGAEALVRWRHPERGLLAPSQFIPLAEANGLIDPIGLWVLQEGCRQLQAWNGGPLAGLRLAINLSARQVMSQDMAQQIAQALARHGVAARRLEVEFTESTAMCDQKRTWRMLSALREMGVRSAIDDFGTGYSSLSQLRSLPFDKLKIDREFVQGIEHSRANAAICRSLVELAHGLGISVLAEGTETLAEVASLDGLGCRLFQGFYFARPVPAQELAELVSGDALRSAIQAAAPFTPPGVAAQGTAVLPGFEWLAPGRPVQPAPRAS